LEKAVTGASLYCGSAPPSRTGIYILLICFCCPVSQLVFFCPENLI